ncbi:MAG: Unknown protein [uncultured Thiotrichaceae bacterium]|uniref:Uncharacterized protein n=1 Tax=uncultured Thiotrichaceae bacterium TaxID=298394 RepID=A0A6S6S6W3_9GAMM|nr:MAG: Unknown protein [uncultured Thiotrichaceae bacterium]
MTEIQAILIIAYVLLTALLVLLLLYGRLHYIFKLMLVVSVGALYLFSYQGWKQVQGWPSKTDLPDSFLLHASVIDEPDQEKGTKGQIFIWASTLKGSFPVSEPRAYEVPYDQEVHGSLEDALRNMRNGNVQLGAKKMSTGEMKKSQYRDGVGDESYKLEFKPLPDPALPEK